MPLSLRIDTAEARQSADAFQRILNDIKTAAATIDGLGFDKLANTVQRITQSFVNLQSEISKTIQLLGTLQYTLNSIVATNAPAKMAGGFRELRDVVRGLRDDVNSLNTTFSSTVRSANAAQESASRSRARKTAREPVQSAPLPDEDVASIFSDVTFAAGSAGSSVVNMSTALTVLNSSTALTISSINSLISTLSFLQSTALTVINALVPFVHQAGLLNEVMIRTASSLVPFVYQGTLVGDVIVRMTAQFDALIERLTRLRSISSQGLLQESAGGNQLARRQPQGVVPFTFEATGGYNRATEQAGRSTQVFAGELVNAKTKKDALDRNLRETAGTTLPGFYQALRLVTGVLAAFTVSNILRELKELGTELFEVGRRTEALEAVFRNATGSVDQAGRLFVIAKDRAKELGLDVLKTAEELGKLSLAAKGTSLEGEKIETLFRGISAAEAVLIQTTGQAGGLIKVFTDILGKGRLQSEELVKQLGNRLPGSIRVVAEAIGKTPQELATAVQRGTVQVEEVLVKLGEELSRRFGGEAALNVFRLGGAFNNLRTAIFELQLLVIKGGFSESLIGAFKALQTFLEDSRTRTAIATLGKTIVDVLGKAFEYLLGVLQFVRDNAQLTIRIFLTLTGATILTGLLGLVNAALLLGRALFAVNVAGATLSRTNLFVALAGLAVSFYAGGLVADKFSESVDGVQESIMKMQQEAERLRNTPAPINNNAADLTRGYADALERVQKELRVLNQEFENQLTLFSVTLSGVSSLSVGYAAYEKTLSRVRALEKNETFEKFGPNAEASKAIVTRNLLNLAFGEQAIERINKNNQDLARLTQERNVIAATFQRASDQFGQVGVSELTTDIQQEYESKVIPVFNDIRQIIAQVQNTAPELAQSLAGAFNEWNKALLNNITSVRQLQGELRGLNQVTGIFRELNVNRLINRLNQPVSGTAVVRSRNPLEAGREAFNLLNPVNTIQPILRSLGPEFEKYGKEQGDRLGKLLEEYQQRNDPTKIIDSELKRVNGYLQNIEKNTDVLRNPASANATNTGSAATGAALISPQAQPFVEIIKAQAARTNVNPEVLARILRAESNFNPNAVGPTNDLGIAQFIPGTAAIYNLKDRRDPAESIRAAADYLSDLIKAARGDVQLAVLGYNRGVGFVDQYSAGGFASVPENLRGYSNKVLSGFGGPYTPSVGGGVREALPQVLSDFSNKITSSLREALLPRRSAQPSLDFNVNATPEDIKRGQDFARQQQDIPRTPGIERISIDIEKASEPIKNIQEDLSKAIQPAQQLEIVLGSLAATTLDLQNSRGDSSIVLGARAEQEIYNESIRTASQLLNTLALTQEDVKNKTDRYKDAVILTAAAFAGTYANGIERNIALSTQSINQLRDETQTLELQQRSLQINVTEREAWIAAEERRQAVLRSGIALDGERGKQIEAEIERLRKLQQATNDLKSDPINRLRDSLGELEKTGPKNLLVNSLNSITDALADVASSGNYSLGNLRDVFASVAQSIIREAIKLTLQLYVLKPLLESLSNSSSLGGGGSSGGSGAGGSDILGLALQVGSVATASSGGIVGRDSFNMRSVPSSVFAHASRFQTGGIIGTDNVPALLTPGEGIFTAEQMKRLAPAGSGSGSNYNFEVVINATDGESVRRTAPQIFGEIYARIERSAARDGSRRRN